jgi:uncharacterized protein (DUF58 family)
VASTVGPRTPGASFVDPRVLARIGDLELIARTVVEGFLSGLHRSPQLGLSTEFAEHRPYMPGDDVRRIDWRLYARTDRHYLKEFEVETNTDVRFLIDISRSMSYGSRGLSKLDYARYLAASLAYFSHGQRDRVGMVTFDADVIEVVPPSLRHLSQVLHAIDRIAPGGEGALEPALARIAESVRRRGIIVLISDLYQEPETIGRAMGRLRGRGSDLIVMQILDPAELEFPFDAAASFEDLETGERMPIVPLHLREQYRALVADHISAIRRTMGEQGIDYVLFDTARPLDHALFEYLAGRQRLRRGR